MTPSYSFNQRTDGRIQNLKADEPSLYLFIVHFVLLQILLVSSHSINPNSSTVRWPTCEKGLMTNCSTDRCRCRNGDHDSSAFSASFSTYIHCQCPGNMSA